MEQHSIQTEELKKLTEETNEAIARLDKISESMQANIDRALKVLRRETI